MRQLVLALALLATPAMADEAGLNLGSGWKCTQVAPGMPRVCGSTHEVYTPPRIITQTVEVDRPVPYPVYLPPEPPAPTAILQPPAQLFVPMPHFHRYMPHPYRHELLSRHY